MAKLRKERAEWSWSSELATYDPDQWECRAAWHLARARAAPNTFVALQEIRASLRTHDGVDDDRAGAVVVEPPALT